jgi:hypothetical protein
MNFLASFIIFSMSAAFFAYGQGPMEPDVAADSQFQKGLKSIEVDFERGHRRDRKQVHWPPHPDSDSVYRITVTAEVVAPETISRVRLVKLPTTTILDVNKIDDASTDIATIDDDDFKTPIPDFDGNYDLTLDLRGGQQFHQQFVAKEMNSKLTPQFLSPQDCEIVSSEKPEFTWRN